MSDLASALAERGYDVGETRGGIVLEIPNPDPRGDAYFHGDNPHVVGFGSRGPDAERISDTDLTADGSTAAVGAPGWNEHAGVSGEAVTSDSAPSGEPDEGWRNDDLRSYAKARGIEVASGANKSELLAAIAAGPAGGEGEGDGEE